MNKNIFRTLAVLTVVFLAAGARAGFVPEYMNYEGTVLDEFGHPGVGTRSFMFMLYDTNSLLHWAEEQTDIPLDSQGAFQVLLGKNTPLPPMDPTWQLKVAIESDHSFWKEMTPAKAMTSVFYAMQAGDARKAPGDLSVSEELHVKGELKVTGLLSAARLQAGDCTAATARVSRLSVSDLSGKAAGPIAVESNMELLKGLTVKGPVSAMRVLNFTADMATNLSGRVYLLAPLCDANLSSIRKFPPSGDILKSDLYEYTLPNHFFFLTLDMTPGEKLVFYGYPDGGSLQQIPPSRLTNDVKIVKMGQ